MAIVNEIALDNIRNNFPKTWERMQDKARWEKITMGAVMNQYPDMVQEYMKKELK